MELAASQHGDAPSRLIIAAVLTGWIQHARYVPFLNDPLGQPRFLTQCPVLRPSPARLNGQVGRIADPRSTSRLTGSPCRGPRVFGVQGISLRGTPWNAERSTPGRSAEITKGDRSITHRRGTAKRSGVHADPPLRNTRPAATNAALAWQIDHS